MMQMEQTAGTLPAQGQVAVAIWAPSSTRGPPSVAVSRFHGDGVRYKAKVIGIDPVPEAQGEKMCWDSMMKLKGFEAAGRKQGKHKQRVWLKISIGGLKIVDERTGALIHDHDRARISSVTKDESDPRAFAYVYEYKDTFCLFYIKMANLADPVLTDIREVLQGVIQVIQQEPPQPPTQANPLLVLNDNSAPPAQIQEPTPEDVLSPDSETSSAQPNKGSSSNELMEVFAIPMQEPLVPPQTASASPPPEPPKPVLSTSQILSMFPTQPPGGSPYSSPPYSPTTTTMPWGQQGPQGNLWAGPAMAPWPSMPGNMAAAWAPVAPPAGGQPQAQGFPPGVMGGGSTQIPPNAMNGLPAAFNALSAPPAAAQPAQPVSPNFDQNFFLG